MGDCNCYPYPRLRTSLFFITVEEFHKIAFTPKDFPENMGLLPKSIGLPLKNFVKKVIFPAQTKSSINVLLKNSICVQPGARGWGGGVGGGGSGQRAKKVLSDSPGLVGLVKCRASEVS